MNLFKKKENAFYESLMKDWGKEDIFGPWTEKKDMYDINGIPKFYKSYYLITTNGKPDIEILDRPLSEDEMVKYFESKKSKKCRL